MIVPQLKIIYVDIPKTGSSSMKKFFAKAFEKNFDVMGNSHPLWLNRLCPTYVTPVLTNEGIMVSSNRHQPLITYYTSLSNIYDHFIFTIVRDPFARFKSALLEFVSYYYFGLSGTRSIDNVATIENYHFFPDPWLMFQKKVDINGSPFHKAKNLEDGVSIQVSLVFNKLKLLYNKGGFERNNLCEYPLHIWPQYYFTNVTVPNPINLLILKFENINEEFTYLKEEIFRFSGCDIREHTFPHVNPLASQIFSYYNPRAIDTIDNEVSKNGIEVWDKPRGDDYFAKKFPTFQDYIPEFNQKTEDLKKIVIPHLEYHRQLIEDLYARDYKQFGYEQQSIKDIPIS